MIFFNMFKISKQTRILKAPQREIIESAAADSKLWSHRRNAEAASPAAASFLEAEGVSRPGEGPCCRCASSQMRCPIPWPLISRI